MKENFRFYIYSYLDDNGLPYYIGKGSYKRAYSKHKNVVVPKNRENIIIMENNLSEIGALALERRYIKWFGRKDLNTGILENKNNGGYGYGMSPLNSNHKNKISKSLKGRIFSDEHREKLSKAGKNKRKPKLSIETKKKISNSLKGRKYPNRIKSVRIYKHTEETKKKMSLAWNEERKNKIRKELSSFKKIQVCCLLCKKDGSYFNFKRYHLDNCGKKIIKKRNVSELKYDFWIFEKDSLRIKVYNLREFSRNNNLNPGSLSELSLGNRKTHKGWKFISKGFEGDDNNL